MNIVDVVFGNVEYLEVSRASSVFVFLFLLYAFVPSYDECEVVSKKM